MQMFRVFYFFLRKGLSHFCAHRAAKPIIRLVYLTAHAGYSVLCHRSADKTATHRAGDLPTAMSHPFARSDTFAEFVFFRSALVPTAIHDFPTVWKRRHRPLHRLGAQPYGAGPSPVITRGIIAICIDDLSLVVSRLSGSEPRC